jgi:tyrosyl-tRNA synthetase
MSKSLGNYIGIDEEAGQIFGKVMSVSDQLMWKYYTLCTDLTPAEVAQKKAGVESGNLHPMEAKRELARSIVTDFHGREAGDAADAEFRKVFSQRELPTDIEEKELAASDSMSVAKLLTLAGLAPSGSEAKRLVVQGGVSVDDQRVSDPATTVDASAGRTYLLKVGKRKFMRVSFVRESLK